METPSSPGPTGRDLQEELTELEFAASQRPLTGPEQQRLQELRRQSEEIAQSAREQAQHASVPGTVVGGDDSP